MVCPYYNDRWISRLYLKEKLDRTTIICGEIVKLCYRFFDSKRFQIINFLICLKYALLCFFAYSLNYHFIFYVLIISVFIVNLLDIHMKWKNLSQNALGYFKRNNHYALLILFSIMIGSQLNV